MNISIKKEVAEKINTNYMEKARFSDIRLKVTDGFAACITWIHGNTGVQVARFEELSDLIKALEKMRDAIEEETGFRF